MKHAQGSYHLYPTLTPMNDLALPPLPPSPPMLCHAPSRHVLQCIFPPSLAHISLVCVGVRPLCVSLRVCKQFLQLGKAPSESNCILCWDVCSKMWPNSSAQVQFSMRSIYIPPGYQARPVCLARASHMSRHPTFTPRAHHVTQDKTGIGVLQEHNI